MSLAVTCFCGYLCNLISPWRSEDYDSCKWVHALKGHELNKHAYVPVRGESKYLSNANLEDATTWFGMFVNDYLRRKRIKGPFLVVPVPNSDCLVNSTTRPRTRKLAKAICDTIKDGSTVLDCLRWKKNLGSASKDGGPRKAEILYGNLTVLKDVLKAALKDADDGDVRVLLVDDVTTSGGHLQACATKLKSEGVTVEIVMCGGKTVYEQKNRAFHIYEDELDDYKS